MQIGGLGSSHSASDHHVTRCIHDHHEAREKVGGGAMKASASAGISEAKASLQQEAPFSLSAWLKNVLGSRKGFLHSFWGDGEAAANVIDGNQREVNSKEGGRTVGNPDTASVRDPDTTAASSIAVQPLIRHQTVQDNPYFSAVEDTGNLKQTFWQRVKVRFHNVSGQLSGRLPRKYFGFQTRNSFQAKQEKPKEDLRKHSRYRQDTVEIDCVLMDDSYLMDSYDRRGEYSKLSTKI